MYKLQTSIFAILVILSCQVVVKADIIITESLVEENSVGIIIPSHETEPSVIILAQRRPAPRPGFKGPAFNKRPAVRPNVRPRPITRPRPNGWRPPNTRPNRPVVIPPTLNPDGTFKPRPRPNGWRPPNNGLPGYRPPNYRPPGYYRPYRPYDNYRYRQPKVIIVTPPPASEVKNDRKPIRNGMRGQRVRVLQLALRDAGLDVDVDGFFGDGTDRAVRNYQKLVGLPVTGVADAQTLSSLGL